MYNFQRVIVGGAFSAEKGKENFKTVLLHLEHSTRLLDLRTHAAAKDTGQQLF